MEVSMKRIVIIMAFSFLAVFLINGETLTSGEFSSIKSSTIFPSDIKLKTPNKNQPNEQNPCLCYSLTTEETGSGFLSATDLISCKVGCVSNNWDGFIYYNSETGKYEYSIAPVFPSDIIFKTTEAFDENNTCLCYSLATKETGDSFLGAKDLVSCKVGCINNSWDGFIFYNSETNKYEYGKTPYSYVCGGLNQRCTFDDTKEGEFVICNGQGAECIFTGEGYCFAAGLQSECTAPSAAQCDATGDQARCWF
jgi:hypothetical protein